MSTAINTFRAQTDHLIGDVDEGELSRDAKDGRVKAAVERYSQDAPDTRTDDVSGDGGRYYGIAASLSGWVEGFSRIVKIEYPAADISADETPTYLESEDWRDDYWKSESGTQTRYLYLPAHSPAATETMRITYTVPYTWSSSPEATDTPAQDFFAICHLAASLCCRALAARYAQLGDSTLGADATAHTTKSSEYANRAKEYMTMYEKHMGLGQEADARAAGDFVDWDTMPGWPGGRQFIFHGKEIR